MVRAGLALALLLAAAAFAAPRLSHAASQPSLTMLHSRPLEVRGSGFHASEAVTLTVRGTFGVHLSHARANGSGGFTATVSAVKLSHCDGYMITAIGRQGDRAVLRRPAPLCGPIE
jgi:hypothetical protein